MSREYDKLHVPILLYCEDFSNFHIDRHHHDRDSIEVTSKVDILKVDHLYHMDLIEMLLAGYCSNPN